MKRISSGAWIGSWTRRALARIQHPHVVQVYRYFEHHDTAYIVEEYADGITLADHLRENGPLEEEALNAVLLQLLDGLEEVHDAGLLHHDIKPDNIILRADGSPVLINFGAARMAARGRSLSLPPIPCAVCSPIEQYSTEGNEGPWTDIYALAVVAYVILTGEWPAAAVDRVRYDPLKPVVEAASGQASPAFLAAVDAGLAVFGDQRPQSLAELKAQLVGGHNTHWRIVRQAGPCWLSKDLGRYRREKPRLAKKKSHKSHWCTAHRRPEKKKYICCKRTR